MSLKTKYVNLNYFQRVYNVWKYEIQQTKVELINSLLRWHTHPHCEGKHVHTLHFCQCEEIINVPSEPGEQPCQRSSSSPSRHQSHPSPRQHLLAILWNIFHLSRLRAQTPKRHHQKNHRWDCPDPTVLLKLKKSNIKTFTYNTLEVTINRCQSPNTPSLSFPRYRNCLITHTSKFSYLREKTLAWFFSALFAAY